MHATNDAAVDECIKLKGEKLSNTRGCRIGRRIHGDGQEEKGAQKLITHPLGGLVNVLFSSDKIDSDIFQSYPLAMQCGHNTSHPPLSPSLSDLASFNGIKSV